MDLGSKYSLVKRIFLISVYHRYDADYKTIFTEFAVKFPNSSVPRRETVYRLVKKFEKHGSVVDAPCSGRPRTVFTNENMMYVTQSYVENPAQSTVRVSADLGISRRSTARIMKNLGLKVYRPHLLQALNEDDPDSYFASFFTNRLHDFCPPGYYTVDILQFIKIVIKQIIYID